MKKLLLLLISLCCVVVLFAQPTVNQSTYDLRFADSVVDCEGGAPIFCVEIQVKSAIGGETFRIGSHTVFFNYNAASIQDPVFTSNLFNNTHICIDETFAAYNAPSFSFDANTAEANFTTIALQVVTEELCPLITEDWETMAEICFEVMDDTKSTDLQFDNELTTLNYIDPTATNDIGDPQDKEEHTQGTLTGLDILPICPCNQTIEQAIAAIQEFCETGIPDLEVAESEIVYSSDGSVFSLEWFIDADYATPFNLAELAHSGTENCTPETFLLYAKVTCSIDATEYDAGTLEVRVHPTPQMPEIMRLDDACTYLVMPICGNDILSETTFDLMPSAVAANRSITVTSPSNENCTADFEVPYEACPDPVCASSIVVPVADLQRFCEGGEPDLVVAELAIEYAGDPNEFDIEWFEDAGFTVPYLNQNFQHSEADLCMVEQDTLFARATCITDNSVGQAGFVAIELFPPLQPPTIVRNDNNCTYTVQPFCTGDVLSQTDFSLMPDSEEATLTIEVTRGGNENCTDSFEVVYEACPPLVCSQSVTQMIEGLQGVCESGFPNLIFAEGEIQYSGDGEVFTLEWFEDAAYTIPYLEHEFSHSLTDVCVIERDTLFVRVVCSTDNSVLNGGTLIFELYPPVQSPEIVRLDDACNYAVIPFCPTDALSEVDFSLNVGEGSGTRTIEVFTDSNSTCSESFEVAYEACPEPVCEQSIEQTIEALQGFCESGIPDLETAEAELIYNGDGSVFTLGWFEDANFETAYNGNALERNTMENCQVEIINLYARATCSTDGSTYIAGILTLQLYREPQAPTIERVDDNCTYQVLPHCENDGLSETSFDLPSGSDTGTRSIEVTSGLEGNLCSATVFEVNYEACPQLVCSQTIVQMIVANQGFCESGTPDLEAAEMELVYNGDGSIFVVEWFEDAAFEMPYDGSKLEHSMQDVCVVETVVLYALATCEDDGSTQLAGTLTVALYPEPQAPMITLINEACTYQVVPVCPEDILSETSFEMPPNSPESSRLIFVNSGIAENLCNIGSFEVPYEACPAPFCDLEIVSVVPSDCDSESNTYDLEVSVTYGTIPNAPIAIDAVGVGTGGGMIDQSGGQTFVLEDLPANGEMNIDVVAGLVIGNICVDTLYSAYDAPLPCSGTPCDELEVGDLPTDNQFVCFRGGIQAVAVNSFVPEGTALAYILHSTPNNALSAPLAIRLDGVFDREEIPNIDLNIPYYISVLGGLDEDGNGAPDLENNNCLKLSNVMPVVFLTEVILGFDVTYYGDTQTFDISITASGGLPAYGAGFYQVLLSNGTEAMINAPFQTVFLEGLNLPEESFGITVTDFAGCLATDFIVVHIEDLPWLEDFKIAYSSNGEVQLQFWSKEIQDLNVALYDLTGRKLLEEKVRLEQGLQTKNLSLMDLPMGVYLLQVGDGKDFLVEKVVRF